MFIQFFGDYLVKQNIITLEQFDEILTTQKSTRVKLGFIAVAEKILTIKQAEEINTNQTKHDKRFGDMAIELGYLDNVQLEHLLDMQGNPYLLFVQTVLDHNILSLKDIDSALTGFQALHSFTDSDINSLKSGDLDKIVPLFINIREDFYNDYISLMLRNIVRFIDCNIRFASPYKTNKYSFDTLANQSIDGSHNIFVALAGANDALLNIANPYAKEHFTTVDADTYDAVCEFINCVNGLFASVLSTKQIDIDMLLPMFCSNKTLEVDGTLYVTPIFINRTQIDLLISIDSKTTLI